MNWSVDCCIQDGLSIRWGASSTGDCRWSSSNESACGLFQLRVKHADSHWSSRPRGVVTARAVGALGHRIRRPSISAKGFEPRDRAPIHPRAIGYTPRPDLRACETSSRGAWRSRMRMSWRSSARQSKRMACIATRRRPRVDEPHPQAPVPRGSLARPFCTRQQGTARLAAGSTPLLRRRAARLPRRGRPVGGVRRRAALVGGLRPSRSRGLRTPGTMFLGRGRPAPRDGRPRSAKPPMLTRAFMSRPAPSGVGEPHCA